MREGTGVIALPIPRPLEPYDAYLSRIVCLAADVWHDCHRRQTDPISKTGQRGHVIDYVGRQPGLFDGESICSTRRAGAGAGKAGE